MGSKDAAYFKEMLNLAISQGIKNYKQLFGELGSYTGYYEMGNEWGFSGFKPYFTRNRKLNPETVISLLLSMQGGSLNRELYNSGIDVTASAFVQQRNKICPLIFESVFEAFNDLCEDEKTYKGYRIFAVDGTTINMARDPKADTFVQNSSNPRGYNQLHITLMYDVLSKTYQHCIIQPQPQQDEVGALAAMMAWYQFPPKTLIVADRGFESYNVIAHFLDRGDVDFLIRVKQGYGAMREVQALPMTELDKKISFTITTTQTNVDKLKNYIYIRIPKNEDRKYKTKPQRWDFGSPYPMKFRIVRFQLDTGEYETLATSLPDRFSLSDIKELYHARWGIETAFRDLKYGLGLVNLHGKKDEFVRQEIFSAMTMANFCARITNLAVIKKRGNTKHEYQVNQKMAFYLCKRFFGKKDADGEELLKDIAKFTEPVRPGRRDERNIKVKSFVGFVYRV